MRWAKKERKKFQSQILFLHDPGKKIQKNNSKKYLKIKKIKKVNTGIISIQKKLREAEKERKKIYSRIPFIVGTGKKIPKKIAKNSGN